MKQISLEDKVNNTLKWLANQIACIQTYHWDEDYKKESLNNAWQKVQEQFKKKTLIGILLQKISVELCILEVGNLKKILKK